MLILPPPPFIYACTNRYTKKLYENLKNLAPIPLHVQNV